MRMCLFSALLCSLMVASGQTAYDSLMDQLRTQPDSLQIKWLAGVSFPYYRSDPELMERLGVKMLELAKARNQGVDVAYNIIGVSFWSRGYYEKAIENYLAALEISQSRNDLGNIASLNINIGNIYDDLGEYEKAKLHFWKGYEAHSARSDSTWMSTATLNLGVVYHNLQLYDSALIMYRVALGLKSALMDSVGLANVYDGMGATYEKLGSDKASFHHHQLAYQAVPKKDLRSVGGIMANLGDAYLDSDQSDKGKLLLDSALSIATQLDNPDLKQRIYRSLTKWALASNDYEQAYTLLRKDYDVQLTTKSEEISERITQLELQYEYEKKANEVLQLKQEKTESRLRLIQVLSIFGLLAVVSIVVVVLLILRIRVNKRNAEQKELNFKKELDRKNRELTSYTINFIQKNELLDQLKARIEELKRDGSANLGKLNTLNKLVNENIRVDQDWENFRIMFEEIHPNFFDYLKSNFSEISNSDLRLSALILMNLNLKESSKILGISPDSVKTARYRLKKKMGLGPEDNMVDFLRELKIQQAG